jgi:hypothetical protein
MIKINTKDKEYVELNTDDWDFMIGKVKNHIEKYDKKPTRCDKNPEIKCIGSWLDRNCRNYKNNIGLMKKEEYREKWKDFADKYSKYL